MIGDIILQKRSGFVGWLVSLATWSEWVHVGIDLGSDIVVHVSWGGKHYAKISEWMKDGTHIIRLTPYIPLLDGQQTALIQCADHLHVKGYSVFHAVWSWLYKNPDDEHDTKCGRFHCSQFVSYAYRQIGLDLVPNRADVSTQPQDFLLSPYLRMV